MIFTFCLIDSSAVYCVTALAFSITSVVFMPRCQDIGDICDHLTGVAFRESYTHDFPANSNTCIPVVSDVLFTEHVTTQLIERWIIGTDMGK